jgi:hypothetical protein
MDVKLALDHVGDSSKVASNQSYGVYGNVKTSKGTGKYGMGIEITSGGPGSNMGKCCGISIGIKADTMKPFIATEDWTEPAYPNQGKHMYLCGGSQSGMKAPDCPNTSSIAIPDITNNRQGIPISWHCDQRSVPGHVLYCGRLDNKMGCGSRYFAAIMDPEYKGKRILPNALGNGPDLLGTSGKPAEDPSRVRTDGLGTPTFENTVAIPE